MDVGVDQSLEDDLRIAASLGIPSAVGVDQDRRDLWSTVRRNNAFCP